MAETTAEEKKTSSTVGEPKEAVKKAPTNDDSNVMALLSYISILSIVMYVVKKDDAFVVFHARQGMVLFGMSIALLFVGIIPVLGWIIGVLGWLFVVVMAIIGMIKAYQGEKYEMPVVG